MVVPSTYCNCLCTYATQKTYAIFAAGKVDAAIGKLMTNNTTMPESGQLSADAIATIRTAVGPGSENPATEVLALAIVALGRAVEHWPAEALLPGN